MSTHLVRVDCNDCGIDVLCDPSYMDHAICIDCRWTRLGGQPEFPPTVYPKAGDSVLGAPPAGPDAGPAITEGHDVAGGAPNAEAAPSRARESTRGGAALLYPVACPRCLWRSRAPDYVTARTMLRVHHHVRHDPAGWASGVAGGVRARGPAGTPGRRGW